MPSQIAHVLLGEQALFFAKIDRNSLLTSVINLGCQGPDIFSHNRRTKPLSLTYSRLLHRRHYGTFVQNYVQNLVNDRDFTIKKSWLLGFATHQILDRLLHPYIVYKSANIDVKKLKNVNYAQYHAFFERILDVCLLKSLRNQPVYSFDTGNAFTIDAKSIDVLSQSIAEALILTFPEEATLDKYLEERIHNAFIDSQYFYHISNPFVTSMIFEAQYSGLSKFINLSYSGLALLHPDEPNPAIDWLNLEKKTWRHPVSGANSTLSVLELFETAVQEAGELLSYLDSVFLGIKPVNVLSEKVGNACLGVGNPDGSIGLVRYFDSFPLAEELEQEAEKRRLWFDLGLVDP